MGNIKSVQRQGPWTRDWMDARETVSFLSQHWRGRTQSLQELTDGWRRPRRIFTFNFRDHLWAETGVMIPIPTCSTHITHDRSWTLTLRDDTWAGSISWSTVYIWNLWKLVSGPLSLDYFVTYNDMFWSFTACCETTRVFGFENILVRPLHWLQYVYDLGPPSGSKSPYSWD